VAIASAFEGQCDRRSQATNQVSAAQAGQANSRPQSCSSARHGGYGGFFTRVARGGFGGAGRGFGG
jgi:hypothetical protein